MRRKEKNITKKLKALNAELERCRKRVAAIGIQLKIKVKIRNTKRVKSAKKRKSKKGRC